MNSNYRRYLLYKGLSLVAFAIPLAVLFGVNFDAYISDPTAGLSFGGYMVCMFLLLGFKTKITEHAKKDIFLSACTVVFVLSIVMMFLFEQLMLISGVCLFGCLCSGIFEKPAAVYWHKSRKRDKETGEIMKVKMATLPHRKAWRIGYIGENAE